MKTTCFLPCKSFYILQIKGLISWYKERQEKWLQSDIPVSEWRDTWSTLIHLLDCGVCSQILTFLIGRKVLAADWSETDRSFSLSGQNKHRLDETEGPQWNFKSSWGWRSKVSLLEDKLGTPWLVDNIRNLMPEVVFAGPIFVIYEPTWSKSTLLLWFSACLDQGI